MSKTALTILDQGEFQFYTVTEHGITFKPETPQADWLKAVEQLCGTYEGMELGRQRTLMLLADALNFGQEAFGEEFAQAIDNTRQALGLTPKRIANAQSVYKKIEASRRRDGITLGHYSVISPFEPEEQDRYMDLIIVHRMTIEDLKEQVASDHPKTKRGKERKTKSGPDTAATALQKLIDVSNFLSEKTVDVLTDKWKAPMKKVNGFFRRKWQPGHKKK